MEDFAPTGPRGEGIAFSREEHHQHTLRTIPAPLPGYAGETQAPPSNQKVRSHPLSYVRRKGSYKVDLILVF